MSAEMERWMYSQHPKTVDGISTKEIKQPVYHLSDNHTIRKFIPRLPESCKKKEDTTVPRICGALSLEGCFNGIPHQLSLSVASLYLYAMESDEIVVPKKTLTNVNVTKGEVWIVPHKLSNWEVESDVVGKFLLAEIHQKGDEYVYHRYIGRLSKPVVCEAGEITGYCTVEIKNGEVKVSPFEDDGNKAFTAHETFYTVKHF